MRFWRCLQAVVRCVLLFSTMIFFAGTREAGAVSAYPGMVEATQPDGKKFQLRLQGDEQFSWNETSEGYAVAKDGSDGYWKYARPASGRAAFEMLPGARVGSVNPTAYNIRRNDMPDRTVLRQVIEARRRAMRSSSTKPSLAATTGSTSADTPPTPPPAQIPVAGTTTIKNIVILACFNDHWDTVNNTVLAARGRVNTTEYSNLFNQTGYNIDGAVGSVRDYYREISYGKLTVDAVVSGWVRLPQNEAYYGADTTSTDPNWQAMIVDAINAAKAAGFNFAQGDSDGDGWADCLTVIHSGYGQEWGGNPTTCIWSKEGDLNSVITKDGVSMQRCHTEPALRGGSGSTGISRIGVICHEMGHFFGLPDLYDYSNITNGLGDWCIMAGGSWNGGDGRSPSHMSAWAKTMLGLVKPVRIHSQEAVALARVEDHPAVHMLQDGMANGEYFLAENRSRTGFDNASEISPGIIIYHVNSQSENNDLGTWPHPAVKIEEADGNDSLGQHIAGSQASDAWSGSNGLAGGFRDQTGYSNANAMLYQSANYYNRSEQAASYSYNQMSGFSAAGATMTYTAATLKPTVASQTVANRDFTVNWGACTHATLYEIQEGALQTLNMFSDSAESEDGMNDNWNCGGTVRRDAGRAKTGSYSYAMQLYYQGKWGSTVQSITMTNPFKVTASSVISYAYLSHLASGGGYLKCQISNDAGNTWKTLGTYSGYVDSWALKSHNIAALNAVGINANDQALIRFVANFESAFGWSAYPGYGYALDDIQITGTEISAYGGWATLASNVAGTSATISGKSSGSYAYRVRAFANGVWQGFGPAGETDVIAGWTVNFLTDGTAGASLTGTAGQTVAGGGNCTPVTANVPAGWHFVNWTRGGIVFSTANPLTVTNVTRDMTLVAHEAINQYTLNYAAGANGWINGATSQTVNYMASGTAVTGVAASGYQFLKWSDGVTSNPRTDINVTTNVSVSASFAQRPQITLQPVAQTVGRGSAAGFVTSASGTGPLSYQWQKNGVNLANTANISGVWKAALQIGAAQDADQGDYSCVVSNEAGGATTNAARLTVKTPGGLSASPPSLSYREGTRLAVDVSRKGGPTTQSLTLTNMGGMPVTFSGGVAATPGLALTGPEAAQFQIVSVKPGTGTPLAAGDSVKLVIQFAPTVKYRTLNLRANLEVTCDSPQTPLLSIPITGDAVPVELSYFHVE